MALSPSKQLHAVAIPLPAQGHINPLMRFCRRLASQHGFQITFVDLIEPFVEGVAELNTQERESIHAPTKALSKRDPASPDANTFLTSRTEIASTDAKAHDAAAVGADEAHEKLDIRRVHIPLEMTKVREGYSVIEAVFEAVERSSPLIEALVLRLMHEDPPISCLISDLYMTGVTQKVADKVNIPRIGFNTTNQSVLLFMNYILEGAISLEQVLQKFPRKEVSKDNTFVKGLLGLPTLRNGDLMDYHADNAFVYTLNMNMLKETKERAHAIAVNSIKELEDFGFKCNIGGVPTYLVGPLMESLDKEACTSVRKEDKECILWLNKQPCRSVIFISFGSFASLSKSQMEEIIAGLICSEQRFLWVFRSDLVKDAPNLNSLVELLSIQHDQGHFVEWAPQKNVLSHPSIGGFLTHCGWNSTTEAITLGVPMLCFPCIGDQFINARFITQEWKVGLAFRRYKESGLVKREEVERVIQALMVGEEGKHLRRNAKEICQKLQNSKTSSKNIRALVDSLR